MKYAVQEKIAPHQVQSNAWFAAGENTWRNESAPLILSAGAAKSVEK
jgi:hypothetical protein